MFIRAARDADSSAIKRLVFSVLREYGLQPDPGTTDSDLDTIEASYFQRGGYFAVIEQEGAVIATVGLHREDARTCELRKMYCLPGQRGRGHGKRLLEFALAKARELGYARVVLETASPLREAIALYRRYGFTPFSPTHLSARCDQAFELRLAPPEGSVA